MKKFHHILAILLSLPFLVHAQGDWTIEGYEDTMVEIGKGIPLGVSFMECVYDHTVYDPVKKKTRVYDEILEVGRDALRYGDYGRYRKDSVMAKDYPDGKIMFSESMRLAKEYGVRSSYTIIEDLRQNKLLFYRQIFMDNYNYEEPIPQFNWTITEGEDELCGYACRKATTSFRGRDWTAWFAEDIPVNRGPWKFNGLPGLILKIEDSKKEHVIEAYQIRQSDRPFSNDISPSSIKTDRLNFNKMMKDFMTNPGNFLAGQSDAPIGLDGKPAIKNRRLFFNPIELE
ncbi:MAG: GLPGLI family protein [Staphylococcus sp.]|nr:GLPGLI family protein [Staphylococcus sp.]